MTEAYIGEIRMFAGNFAPAGWMFCEGQLLPISENDTLFNLIGTTYGGDGQSTFALPDLRGRIPVHQGSGLTLAATGGAETISLTTNELPSHSHSFLASNDPGNTTAPQNAIPAASNTATTLPYGTAEPLMTLDPAAVSSVGGSQPHSNLQPYLCINFIISLFGIYPSPS